MKLDMNKGNGRGKYALIKLRSSAITPKDVETARRCGTNVGISPGAVDFGDTPDSAFFVIRLKDKFAAKALLSYANAVRAEVSDLLHAKDSKAAELEEYAREVEKLATTAREHPAKALPNAEQLEPKQPGVWWQTLVEQLNEMRAAVERSNELLRSCHAVAHRTGHETNWSALLEQLDTELQKQFHLMHPKLKPVQPTKPESEPVTAEGLLRKCYLAAEAEGVDWPALQAEIATFLADPAITASLVGSKVEAVESVGLGLEDAIRVASGCTDYSGGHTGDCRDAFHHGIQTVVTALEALAKNGLADTQTAALWRMGNKWNRRQEGPK